MQILDIFELVFISAVVIVCLVAVAFVMLKEKR